MNPHRAIFPARIIGVMFLLFALIPAVIATVLFHHTREFIRHAAITQAVVVANQQRSDTNSTLHFAVFRFIDANGNPHNVVNSIGSSHPIYTPGQTLPVLYTSSNPAATQLNTFFNLWFAPTLTMLLATIPAAIGLALIFLLPITIRRVWPGPPSAHRASTFDVN